MRNHGLVAVALAVGGMVTFLVFNQGEVDAPLSPPLETASTPPVKQPQPPTAAAVSAPEAKRVSLGAYLESLAPPSGPPPGVSAPGRGTQRAVEADFRRSKRGLINCIEQAVSPADFGRGGEVTISLLLEESEGKGKVRQVQLAGSPWLANQDAAPCIQQVLTDADPDTAPEEGRVWASYTLRI
jgi:hypothetical protein